MAVCKYCGKEMLDRHSCLPKVSINGKVYDRIRFGDERRSFIGDICHDCGCKKGDFHHFCCDMEESPATHRQMFSEILEHMDIHGKMLDKAIFPLE